MIVYQSKSVVAKKDWEIKKSGGHTWIRTKDLGFIRAAL